MASGVAGDPEEIISPPLRNHSTTSTISSFGSQKAKHELSHLYEAKIKNTFLSNTDKSTFGLSVKNPDGGEKITHRTPATIIQEIAELDAESAKVLEKIKALL